ncbi:unnamed protein product [Fraxinus pennsylvanica]|uniref:Uncharacterized protein n=1 Tax=Fraxinus pennsylvanica TaxID=56036 RepID=A0AAD2AFB1_9LAMI|nr:unnamed protein product [Fraxinus pennsylvanica]
MYLRAKNGDLRVRTWRANRDGGIGGHESSSEWNYSGGSGNYKYFSAFLKGDDSKLMHRSSNNGSKVKPQSVMEAIFLATNGQPFEVAYYPRTSTPKVLR